MGGCVVLHTAEFHCTGLSKTELWGGYPEKWLIPEAEVNKELKTEA
jgi:hypothetical protein